MTIKEELEDAYKAREALYAQVALSRSCGMCEVKAGEPCVSKNGKVQKRFHTARISTNYLEVPELTEVNAQVKEMLDKELGR